MSAKNIDGNLWPRLGNAQGHGPTRRRSRLPGTGLSRNEAVLERRVCITALFSFNDVSAIGAIEALRSHGLDVPRDVSVVGFDDIQSAAYPRPQLTTVRQPLKKMGMIAAEALLRRVARPDDDSHPRQIVIEPELVVRKSTAAVAKD